MAKRPALAPVAYNSPINLYSEQNIQEAIAKQSHVLANGAVGIDFHNLAKPGNLAHSEVLKMVEEEETMRGRYSGPGSKKVTWPPPPEEAYLTDGVEQLPEENQGPGRDSPYSPVRGVVRQPEPAQHQGYPGQGLTRQNYQPQQQQQQQQQQPAPKPQSPYQPSQQHQAYQQPQTNFQQKAPTPPPFQRVRFSPVNFEPPKATVTLLPSAPVNQEPPLVYASQPVAASVMGGNRMRGDEKWPPETVKQQSEAENAARVALAKGPTCRPRRVRKDYSSFFAQHALNPTYPSYKAPPGTQHYIEEGTSQL